MAHFIFAKSQESSSSWDLLETIRNSVEAAQTARGYRQTLTVNIRMVEAESEAEAVQALEYQGDRSK